MTMFYDVKEGDHLVLLNKDLELGPIRALAAENKEDIIGDTAYMRVDLYSGEKLGIASMTINVNYWDVYKTDDPKLANVLLDYYQPVKG